MPAAHSGILLARNATLRGIPYQANGCTALNSACHGVRSFVSDGSVFYRGNGRMIRFRLRAYAALAFVAVLAACNTLSVPVI
jgi:hypothetical protein